MRFVLHCISGQGLLFWYPGGELELVLSIANNLSTLWIAKIVVSLAHVNDIDV